MSDQITDKFSYSLGVNLGNNLKKDGFSGLNYEDLAAGIRDMIEGFPIQMDLQEAVNILKSGYEKMQQDKHGKNIEEGQKFLEENGKRAEVTTTASGLQYEVMQSGSGSDKPTASSTVTTHYHGTLISGEIFDSSVQRGQPASFPVNGVIKGWTEALQLMTPGDKWKLFLPHDLAYGPQGAGGKIGPYSTLIFEVELISIN